MNREELIEMANLAERQPVYDNVLFPPSRYYRFFSLLARRMCPQLSVVCGLCGGGCALHLAKGYSKGAVIGIDIAYDHPEHITHIQANFPNFIFMQGDSVGCAKLIEKKNMGKVDILFIDTDHTYQRTMDEFNAYRPLLSSRAVVCLDDLFRPGMVDAYDELPGEKIRLDDLHHGGSPTDGGFAVIWNIPPL